MKLGQSPHLDALCGEYLLGTLRGPARARFERACAQEPRVALRLQHWQHRFTPQPSEAFRMPPTPPTWQRIARDLDLRRYRQPWYARVGVWRGWALATSAALAVWVGVVMIDRSAPAPAMRPIATLASGQGGAAVVASLSDDGRWLALAPARPVEAGPQQSYELWLLPPDGSAPVSVAVMGQLGTQLPVPAALVGRLQAGAKLAVSVEPAGGSPTGAPTGPVILVGAIGAV
ncbi:anti-sigma factor [Denitromonas iodatirespirans]|uniref:Anti-sigma factor n=1 Tax=Denitromonas iodatirespirans TaxID=2795389 RepID=A0A944H7A9_DENI1|nr:anti-sigma factor [Denitromonas iodatirespirans]MBT0960999.1 anti-sigma factor [Denitromonas iodatirespirans]